MSENPQASKSISHGRDPYKGNITTLDIQGLKLYLNAIKHLENKKCIGTSVENGKQARNHFEAHIRYFGWCFHFRSQVSEEFGIAHSKA